MGAGSRWGKGRAGCLRMSKQMRLVLRNPAWEEAKAINIPRSPLSITTITQRARELVYEFHDLSCEGGGSLNGKHPAQPPSLARVSSLLFLVSSAFLSPVSTVDTFRYSVHDPCDLPISYLLSKTSTSFVYLPCHLLNLITTNPVYSL